MAGTRQIKFSSSPAHELRRHYLGEDDVRVLLERLPKGLWSRLRAVHFNDLGRGVRRLGYTSEGRREIAICALPPQVSLSRFLIRRSPRLFGAARGRQWPKLAVRRYLLYDVFLHALGRLQIVDETARNDRRRFASQTKAQEFADQWRKQLWEDPFDHPDPVHNRPTTKELEGVAEGLEVGR